MYMKWPQLIIYRVHISLLMHAWFNLLQFTNIELSVSFLASNSRLFSAVCRKNTPKRAILSESIISGSVSLWNLSAEEDSQSVLKVYNKKAHLSLTNLRDAKVCQKLLQFHVLTTLSLTIGLLAYLHAFSCCGVWNLRNPEKFTENSNLWSSRSSKVIDLGANRKPIFDLLLVINSNFSHICYRSRDIHG